MYFDSHAHLTCDTLFPSVDDQLKRATDASVSAIANICTDRPTLERGLQLTKKYPWVYNVGATTPHDVSKLGDSDFPIFEKAAMGKQLIAVGESGLDYHYEHSPKNLQQEFLKRYFDLAQKTNLPIVIHCRDAFDDLFTLADSHYEKSAPLILHCFTGTLDEALEVTKRGWYLSLSGIVTFKRSDVLRSVAAQVPIDQLLLETDAPYLAPMPYRGKQNESAYIIETAKCIAATRNIDPSELAQATSKNAQRVFSLKLTS